MRPVDPLHHLVFVTPPAAQEVDDERVHQGTGLIDHLTGHVRGRGEQLNAFGLVPAEPPVPAGASSEPHRRLRLAGRERAAHRGTDVVVFGLERGKPFQLLGAAKMRLRGLGECGEVGEMRVARQVGLPRLGEPLPGVLLDRAVHPVARCVVGCGAQQ